MGLGGTWTRSDFSGLKVFFPELECSAPWWISSESQTGVWERNISGRRRPCWCWGDVPSTEQYLKIFGTNRGFNAIRIQLAHFQNLKDIKYYCYGLKSI